MSAEQLLYDQESDERIRKDYEAKMSLLSSSQRKAVIDFLTYLRDVEEFDFDASYINETIDYILKLGQSAGHSPP